MLGQPSCLTLPRGLLLMLCSLFLLLLSDCVSSLSTLNVGKNLLSRRHKSSAIRERKPSLRVNDREKNIIRNADQSDDIVTSPNEEATAADGDLPFFANWPKWMQNGIRDFGGVRLFVNTATRTVAAPIFYRENPWCFPEFVRISGQEYSWLVSAFRLVGIISKSKPGVSFVKEAYGDHPSQVAQVMISKDTEKDTNKAAPLFIFLHGGVWGSGFPTMYRLLSLPFLERNFCTIILGYRTFPDASIEGQVDDLVLAVDKFTQTYRHIGGNSGPVVLMGHSSGAHVCMLAAMSGQLPSVDALIGASGIYDIEEQFKQENKMGVSEISPMAAANGFTLENFRKFSPAQQQKNLPAKLPPMLLIHGGSDEFSSPQNSKYFSQVLGKGNCELEIMEGVGHQEIVLDTCVGGKTQSVICDWIESTVKL